MRAAEAGDELARRVIEEAAEYLAVAAGTLINLLNPELIVLGGSVGAESAHLLQQLREKVRSRAMAYPLSGVTIRRCTFGPDSGAVGAAVMVLQQVSELLFSEPQSGSAGDGGT